MTEDEKCCFNLKIAIRESRYAIRDTQLAEVILSVSVLISGSWGHEPVRKGEWWKVNNVPSIWQEPWGILMLVRETRTRTWDGKYFNTGSCGHEPERESVSILILVRETRTLAKYQNEKTPEGIRGFWGRKRIRTAVEAFAELCLATRPQDL